MKPNFNKKIEIHGNTKSENRFGEETYSFGKLKTIWASIIPQTGALQRQQAETILTNVTHKIIVRYSAGKDIKKEHKIYYNNREYEIKFILNPYETNEFLEVFVEEVLT